MNQRAQSCQLLAWWSPQTNVQLDRTISCFFFVSLPPQGKIKETLDFLSCKSLGDCVILIFLWVCKDNREKGMENNGDEIAVLFPEGHEAIQITY